MNNQATIEKLKLMRLKAMAETHQAHVESNMYSDHTLDQYLAVLADREWEYRQNRKITNLIKRARFRINADIREVDYTSKRNLNRMAFERLAGLDFLKRKENIILTGPTGTGKSFLAQAIGHQACIFLHKTLYYPLNTLMEEIQTAKAEGNFPRLMKRLSSAQLLILDDFGLFSLNQTARQDLMELVDRKYSSSSMIITSQIPVSKWHELIGEGTIADAIMDRIAFSSHRIQLKGASMRKKNAVKNNSIN